MATEQDLQQKAIYYQLLQRRAEELREQMMIMERQFLEVQMVKEAANDFDRTEEGTEVLLNIGAGCFSRAKTTKNKKLLVNIGAGVLAEKTREEALKFMDERMKEIHALIERTHRDANDTVSQMNEIAAELEKAG